MSNRHPGIDLIGQKLAAAKRIFARRPTGDAGAQAPEARVTKSRNIGTVQHRINARMHHERNGHRGGVLWFTGLSGSGKSTLAIELEQRLHHLGYQVYVLDGDNLRHGLNSDLGFSAEDRAENIRRVGEVAALFAGAGILVIAAFISPYRADRDRARAAAGDSFHEIHVHADLEICETRDPKGLYKKARLGEIPEFTGISAPYEVPENCELVIDTSNHDVGESVEELLGYVAREFPNRISIPSEPRQVPVRINGFL